jgi:phosphoribosylformylglycinamidine synthase
MWSGLGARLRLGVSSSPAIELFGESPGRLVLSCRPRQAAAIELLARQFGLAAETLGTVGGDRLRIELTGEGATGAAEERGSRVADALDVSLADLRHTWDHGLARALGVEHGSGHEQGQGTEAVPRAVPPGIAADRGD